MFEKKFGFIAALNGLYPRQKALLAFVFFLCVGVTGIAAIFISGFYEAKRAAASAPVLSAKEKLERRVQKAIAEWDEYEFNESEMGKGSIVKQLASAKHGPYRYMCVVDGKNGEESYPIRPVSSNEKLKDGQRVALYHIWYGEALPPGTHLYWAEILNEEQPKK